MMTTELIPINYEGGKFSKIARDLSGQRFGRLVAIRPCGKNKFGNFCWLCKCDCGKEHIVASGKLVSGSTKSCGCYAKDVHIKQLEKHGITTGGKPRTFTIWNDMKARCLNPNSISYKRYGGRGISICEKWLTFKNFHEWAMNSGYADGLEIDRIDNNGDYCPENCRWVSSTFNKKHQRNTRYIKIQNVTMNVSEWCRAVKMPKCTAYKFLHESEESFKKEVEKRILESRGQNYFVNKFLAPKEAMT